MSQSPPTDSAANAAGPAGQEPSGSHPQPESATTPTAPAPTPAAAPAPPPATPAPAPSAAEPSARSADSGAGDGEGSPEGGAEGGAERPPGAPRKRRRGSRGGRNRNKPRPAAGADADDLDDDDLDADDEPGDDEPGDGDRGARQADATGPDAPGPNAGGARPASRSAGAGGAGAAPRASGPPRPAAPRRPAGDDYTDAAADRGLTTEDALITAREEAGLPAAGEDDKPRIGDTRPAPPKPKIGDTRPAPVAVAPGAGTGAAAGEAGAGGGAKKRRRRGGRGRGKGGQGPGGQGQGGQGQGQGQGGQGRGAARPAAFVDGTVDTSDATGAAILDQLDDATLERRRGLSRKGRPTGRYQMVVHVKPEHKVAQIAVLEGRNLVEHYVSEPADDVWSIDGNIYLGKVQNVLPGMEAAFIDIGTPKNGVLYRGDVAFDVGDTDGGERPKIERMLKNGQSIIVQVTKNPIGHKGARLTQEVSLAGRFVVMVPGQPGTYGISKRMPDDERKRLRRILDRLRPDDAGLIVRTAAEGATEDELALDLRRLKAQWQEIADLAKRSKPGSLLYKEPALVLRIIREEFTKEFRSVVIDDRELYEQVKDYLEAMAPELADRVEHYDPVESGLPVFERFHVHEQLHKALDRKVWLPSGGSLVIERTEALTVIDVNTGKNVGRSNLEETVYRNNLEAAEAIARELRLRDIGGIIVIDFIDMEIKQNREDVERTFRDALARDKTRTQVFPISELGLLEMTRKRISEGLVESFSQTCEVCAGRGIVLDESMLE